MSDEPEPEERCGSVGSQDLAPSRAAPMGAVTPEVVVFDLLPFQSRAGIRRSTPSLGCGRPDVILTARMEAVDHPLCVGRGAIGGLTCDPRVVRRRMERCRE